MRLGVDETGVTELMGVTEHTRCLSVVAAGLLLESMANEGGLMQPVDPTSVSGPFHEVLDEIRALMSATLGTARIPTIWLTIARNPHYLESTWRKERVVMRDGVLTARDKRRVALGVAMNARSRYMIEYNTTILRHVGEGDEEILEILSVVDHYNCLNTLSDGMQLDSDIRPLP